MKPRLPESADNKKKPVLWQLMPNGSLDPRFAAPCDTCRFRVLPDDNETCFRCRMRDLI